ncbi:hypothetical protein [Croceicoccus gelatinilyticus]|uniref:hypothetical protein n=1 Tax=Croceicoccus gelatinilyticus TaxID=2835536 RepID=UPI001BD13452|nr:hypothetical protein [Croceicoccus gelatinilyticus]MBS7670152.1 hypothetical protein [Croceicoccus gelatinilyticus]
MIGPNVEGRTDAQGGGAVIKNRNGHPGVFIRRMKSVLRSVMQFFYQQSSIASLYGIDEIKPETVKTDILEIILILFHRRFAIGFTAILLQTPSAPDELFLIPIALEYQGAHPKTSC